MTTSAVCAPISLGYAVLGAVAVQQQSGLPRSPEAETQSGLTANASARRERRATSTRLPGVPTINVINVQGLFLCHENRLRRRLRSLGRSSKLRNRGRG